MLKNTEGEVITASCNNGDDNRGSGDCTNKYPFYAKPLTERTSDQHSPITLLPQTIKCIHDA